VACAHRSGAHVSGGHRSQAAGDGSFHRQLTTSCGQHQCRGRDYFLRVLLRLPLPVAGRRSRRSRADAAVRDDRASGNRSERASTGGGGRGNVETSQRIVDVLLRALAKGHAGPRTCGSSGTMNI